MYMIWHKKLGLMRLYPFKLQAVLWCWLHGKDEHIEIINTKEKNYERTRNEN